MAEKNSEFNQFDDQVIQQDEVLGSDTTINPDFHIHLTIRSLGTGLVNANIQEGFLQYVTHIEHLVVLCKAAKYLKEETFKKDLELFKNSDETKKETDPTMKMVKLAQWKLEKCLEQVFQHKTSTGAHRA